MLDDTIAAWTAWVDDEITGRVAADFATKLEEVKHFEKNFAKAPTIARYVATIADLKKGLKELSAALRLKDKQAGVTATQMVSGGGDTTGGGSKLAASAKVSLKDYSVPNQGTGWEVESELLKPPFVPVVIPAERFSKIADDITAPSSDCSCISACCTICFCSNCSFESVEALLPYAQDTYCGECRGESSISFARLYIFFKSL